MTQEKIKFMAQTIIIISCVYLFILCFMYLFQRSFTFQPSRENPFLASHDPFQPVLYQTPMGLNLRGLYVPAQSGKPTVVYFQGNAGHIGDRLFKTPSFIQRGYGFFLVGYRGYSGNPGQPTETNFYEDARSAINKLIQAGIPIENIIIYGESIGTGVATQMATEFPTAKALILEAPFTSTVDIAKRIYWFLPVEKMMKDRFENDKKIGQLTMPVLIIHGTKDFTVPYRYGQKLFTNVVSHQKEFVTLEGAGHANVYDFNAAEHIHAFLDRL